MTDKFYGRSVELEVLRDELDQVRSSGRVRLIAVQGRRQVGKSRLIEHFAEDSGVPYAALTGMKGVPEGIQVARALESVRAAKRPLAERLVYEAATPASSWANVVALLSFAVGEDPGIVVLDEFPWMLEASQGLDGLLKALLDGDLGRKPVLMILVGSDEAMMERLFQHDKPLFGKADRRLLVNPFNPAETKAALGGERTALEVFDAQLVTGGFPALVDQARRASTISQFVTTSLAERNSTLVDAAQIRLLGELSDSENARLVLAAIGADEIGVTNFSRIEDRLGAGAKGSTAVTRSIDVLVNTKRIVAVDLPAGAPKSPLKRYRIADSYLRFWFRFVEPYLRSIEVGRHDVAVTEFKARWSTWRGKAIEPIVRESFLLLVPRLDAPFSTIESVGAWWDRRGLYEFDLVGTDRKGLPVAVGSVKWRSKERVDGGELADLAGARSVVKGAGAAKLVVVSPTGTKSGVEPDLLLGADELLAAWS
jgi:AAA+ ATPase superfamily predicted ATPase